jgi:hypothetical protein
MEAKCDFHIEHDGNGSNDTFNGPWMPARLTTGHGDFIEGQMNFYDFDFKSKSGMAYDAGDGKISLIVHSNASYTLRPKLVDPVKNQARLDIQGYIADRLKAKIESLGVPTAVSAAVLKDILKAVGR